LVGGVEQVVVGHVGEQAAVQRRLVRHAVHQPEPHLLDRLARLQVADVGQANVPELERPHVLVEAADLLRDPLQHLLPELADVSQVLRRRHVGHVRLVFGARLRGLE